MADQSQTPEATPRPWSSGGDEVYAGSGDTYVEVCRMYGDAPLADDNAALIVAAVNAYDRLRRIEAAARDLIDLHDGDEHTDETWPCDGRCLQARALRAALEEKP